MIIIPCVLIGIYLFFFIKKRVMFYKQDINIKIANLISVAAAVVLSSLCLNMWGTPIIFIIHFVVFSIVIDLAALILRKLLITKDGKWKLIGKKLYLSGIVPVIIVIVVFTYGYINMGHIVETKYDITTEKNIDDYRIVLISDTHYGTIQSKDILKNKIDEINAQKPDILILGGDIVEENTSKEDMQDFFNTISNVNTTYGIYYVYGNHDRQPYSPSRTYTDEDLNSAIQDNGIIILDDSYVEINDDIILVGRADGAWGRNTDRLSAEELSSGLDKDKYIISINHQADSISDNALAGIDLELSGHTHGGQIWPIGAITELMGSLNYGEYEKDGSTSIVSSGFTGWGYPIRTEKNCEYVTIDISGKGKAKEEAEQEAETVNGYVSDNNILVPDDFNKARDGIEYGENQEVEFYSTFLERQRKLTVTLPAGYDSNESYPVLYLMCGLGCNYTNWPSLGADTLVNNAINDYNGSKMILVSATTFSSKETESESGLSIQELASGYDNFISELLTDIMPYIENNYNVKTGPENTALAGFSMGGREALYIGFRHPELFGYIGAFSPANGVVEDTTWSGNALLSSFTEYAEIDSFKFIMLSVGDEDPVCKVGTESYNELMTQMGIEHLFYEIPGGHDGNVWQNMLYNFAYRIF